MPLEPRHSFPAARTWRGLTLATILVSMFGVGSAEARTTFELRQVVDCLPNQKPMKLQATHEILCLSDYAVVKGEDVTSVSLEPKPEIDEDVILITLNKAAAARMGTLTSAQPDDGRIGIIFDGSFVSAPFVHGVMSDTLEIVGIKPPMRARIVSELKRLVAESKSHF